MGGIGLHPLDVRVLLGVRPACGERRNKVVVIEHDLDVIANADWIIDMGSGRRGGSGGRIVADAGTGHDQPAPGITGRYLKSGSTDIFTTALFRNMARAGVGVARNDLSFFGSLPRMTC